MAEKKDQVAKAAATDTKKPAKKADAAAPAKAAKKTDAPAPAKSNNPDRNRLKKRYTAEIVPALMKERGYTNVLQVPRLEKIILNMRLGDIKDNSKSIQLAQSELEAIAGQKAVLVKAKKSVANFKLRETSLSASRSRSEATECMSFSISSLQSHSRACATSEEFPQSPSTAEETTQWALRNRSCSPKSLTKPLKKSADSISVW